MTNQSLMTKKDLPKHGQEVDLSKKENNVHYTKIKNKKSK